MWISLHRTAGRVLEALLEEVTPALLRDVDEEVTLALLRDVDEDWISLASAIEIFAFALTKLVVQTFI